MRGAQFLADVRTNFDVVTICPVCRAACSAAWNSPRTVGQLLPSDQPRLKKRFFARGGRLRGLTRRISRGAS
jgi:hypothetical protein